MVKCRINLLWILLLSGCASERQKLYERDRALERTQQFTLYPIRHQSEYTGSILTRNIAVSTALQKNAALQANFEQLGIAGADLEKAGVFTNPYLDAIFALPKDKTTQPALNFYLGILRVSDLWLVPIKRKIAEDELEIVSWEVTTQALKVIRDTQLAYNACVRANSLLQLSDDYAQAIQDLATSATTHHDGFPSNFKIKMEHIKNSSYKKTAVIHLQQLLGMSIHPEVELEKTFTTPDAQQNTDIQSCITAVQLSQHPTMIINQIRITRARHQLSYEQRRCMEDVTIGYNYVNWFDGVAGSGPFFHMSFPIGSTTHAEQRKARSIIAQCEQEANAALQLLQRETDKLFVELTSLGEQIELVGNELKTHDLAQLQHSQENFNRDATEQYKQALLSALSLHYETEQSFINLLHAYHETLVNLDYIVGGGILKKIYGHKNSCT